ncbi:MAG: cyclic nucleotide-binding domain-containing protein [Burkholderiaceae bacterium]
MKMGDPIDRFEPPSDLGTTVPVLPAPLIEALRAVGRIRVFERNVVVVVQGEPAQTLYLVIEGALRVFVADDEGREAELAQLGPGETFGEMMLASALRTASVRTLGRCRLCMVGRAEFEALLHQRPDLMFHLVQTLIHRVMQLTGNVQSLSLMDVYGRVARLLLDEAVTGDDGQRQVPRMSQQRIADRVGASRSMIHRILKDLVDGGYITIGQSSIVLNKTPPRRW